MAQKGGFKRLVLVLVFIVLAIIVFALMGGGKLLKSAGTKTEEMKGKLEKGAVTIEKKAEKVKDAMSSGDKK
jgi:Na+-transporting methylmalonyl-CoA/oxaloacetate decarboxylase gamma subunit